MRQLRLAALALVFSISLHAQPTIDSILTAAVAKSQVPGIAAVVVRSGGIIESGAAGVRRMGTSDRMQANDLLHFGSITKGMTATLVAGWVERGKLAWTSRPTDIFPDLKSKMDVAFREVTLADLLNHRAGLSGFQDGSTEEFREGMKAAGSGSPRDQRRRFTYWLLERKPALEPRTQMQYSNAGYAVAAAMLEQVTRNTWESLIIEDLWGPLNMRTAGFGWPGKRMPFDQPWGHQGQVGAYRPHDPNGDYQLVDFLAAGGTASMTIGDYGRFLQMHLQGLAGRDTMLKAETVRALHTPIGQYGFGWVVRNLDGHVTHSHSGSAGTFFALTRLWPNLDLAIAVVVNAFDGTARGIAGEVAENLRNHASRPAR